MEIELVAERLLELLTQRHDLLRARFIQMTPTKELKIGNEQSVN
jgi:hypothetical protein